MTDLNAQRNKILKNYAQSLEQTEQCNQNFFFHHPFIKEYGLTVCVKLPDLVNRTNANTR